MQLAEKAANQIEIEMRRLQHFVPSRLCRIRHELREIAVVRRHRVRRDVAIQAEVVEKAAELFHRSRSASARSDVAALRSAFLSCLPPACSGGGVMIPNVMLLGW